MNKKLLPYFLPGISLVILAADLLTKKAVWSNLGYAQPVEVLGNFFRLTFVYNEGITFGMFNNANKGFMPFVLMALALLALALVGYLYVKIDKYLKEGNPQVWGRVALTFIVGGALGNIIDRMFLFNDAGRKSVVDFLDVGIGKLRWYTFNVADSFVVIGSILLAILFLFFEIKKDKTADTNTVVSPDR